jgi:hypothetical protein
MNSNFKNVLAINNRKRRIDVSAHLYKRVAITAVDWVNRVPTDLHIEADFPLMRQLRKGSSKSGVVTKQFLRPKPSPVVYQHEEIRAVNGYTYSRPEWFFGERSVCAAASRARPSCGVVRRVKTI